jgi:hypothetical protein
MKAAFLSFAALLVATPASADCPIDNLRKAASDMLTSKERTKLGGAEPRSTEGGEFIIYFDAADDWTLRDKRENIDKDSGSVVYAIRSTVFGEMGQSLYRITFLNKDDFAIRAIAMEYEDPIAANRGTEILNAKTTDYFFCDGALQMPANLQGASTDDYAKAAESARTFFFETPELAPYIKRVKP